MDKAIISLSFDDGREDNYRLFKKFTIPHNIPVTLNVATAYVDGSMPAESWPTKKGPMTKEQIIELSGCSSIELALHGDAHDNTEPDVRAGRDKLASWIGSPEDGKWGFASPYSKLPVEDFVSPDAPPFFKNDILYMRTGLKKEPLTQLQEICRKACKLLPLPIFYHTTYGYAFMQECPDKVIYSFPIFNALSFAYVKGIIDTAIRYKGAVTLMFHSIEPDSASVDEWSWDSDKFRKLCAYLVKMQKRNKLDIATTRDLYNKIKTD